MPMANIIPIPAFNDNYIWMIVHPSNSHAVIVDPGDAKPVIAALKDQHLELTAILITHHHWDHTGGIDELLAYKKVPVYGPANDPVPQCTEQLGQDDRINIPNVDFTFEVLDIPGHTRGHIAYVGLDGVFCGDTLFAAGCGRLFEGTPAEMYQSLQKLAALPGETKVYCAHEYTKSNLQFAKLVEPNNPDILKRIEKVATLRANNQPTLPSYIDLELATNPFLRCHQESIKHAAKSHAGHALTDPIEIFATIRRWKDSY